MGNCGVGLRAGAPGQEDWLIQLMEGVEDIPGTALAEGITWGWETFPEYLDALDTMPRAIDVGTQVPHGAVRAYVMGERGAPQRARHARRHRGDGRPRRARRSRPARSASPPRARSMHRAVDGEPVPGTFAAEDELFGIGQVLGELGTGALRARARRRDGRGPRRARARRSAWMRRLSADHRPAGELRARRSTTSRPTSGATSCASRRRPTPRAPTSAAQVGGRPLNLLIGFQTFHPFVAARPTRSSRDLPLDRARRRAAQARGPRARSSPRPSPATPLDAVIGDRARPHASRSASRPTTSPTPDTQHRRDRRARRPRPGGGALRRDARARRPRAPDVRAARLQLRQPRRHARDDPAPRTPCSASSDGGAHCGAICDASHPHVHAHALGARPRPRRPRLPLELVVQKQTARHRRALRPRRPRRGRARASRPTST